MVLAYHGTSRKGEIYAKFIVDFPIKSSDFQVLLFGKSGLKCLVLFALF